MSSFGERLKRLRDKTGKTQAEVAAEISARFPDNQISQTGLSALENRDTAPRETVLRILSNYYHVSPTYFLEDQQKIEQERRSRRQRALEYINEISHGNTAHSSRVSAHSMRFRRRGDRIQEVLEKIEQERGAASE